MLKLKIASAKSCCGTLMLINRDHPLGAETVFNPDSGQLVPLCSRQPDILLQRIAACKLYALISNLQAWGKIMAISAYRSQQEQENIYADSLRQYGADFTARYVAALGCSEHQSGLAVDMALIQPQINFITPEFPRNGVCQKFRELAPRYGFIERYPQGKQPITGIDHEPWHFRYVGSPHAQLITSEGVTLEEYLEQLNCLNGKAKICHVGQNAVKISVVPASDQDYTVINLNGNYPYTLSGNNLGGFVVTEWGLDNG